MKYEAIIFDLDGVVVSTDNCHYEAWKQLADEEGIYFDRTINERLRGVSRMESLEIVLEKAEKSYTEDEKFQMAERKNGYYKELIKKLDKTAILEGAEEFITDAKSKGIKVAIGSSSKNTIAILTQIGLLETFDKIADGNDIKNSKPAPDVFLKAAEKLGIEPTKCVVVEDADAGVEAALAANMDVIAVGYASANPKCTYSAKGLFDIKVDDIM
ncbi:MAG: beta-phosphoglucomutase [Ruminococcaceae bacterium]|nr:beta-phosphoglucomutase [Oscillospiraceae bacterium]